MPCHQFWIVTEMLFILSVILSHRLSKNPLILSPSVLNHCPTLSNQVFRLFFISLKLFVILLPKSVKKPLILSLKFEIQLLIFELKLLNHLPTSVPKLEILSRISLSHPKRSLNIAFNFCLKLFSADV